MSSPARAERDNAVLSLIGLPALIDEIGVNGVEIGLAQNVAELFYAP